VRAILPGVTTPAPLRPAAPARPDATEVEVVDLVDLDQHAQATDLLARVWRSALRQPPLPADLLVALAHTGGYVSGAHLDGRLVGASVGFVTAGGALHSHVTGVAGHARGRGVGTALKLHQRRWALDHGLDAVTWTFDPLRRANAWFNLTRLGAVADAYLPHFYGDQPDELNAGDETDRLAVRWDVRGPRAEAAARGAAVEPREPDLLAGGAAVVLEDRDGRPVALDPPRTVGAPLLLRVPLDVAAVRATDPPAALRWRRALRGALQPLVAAGRTVTGMTRTGCYVVTEGEA
jgi:predicted GNAT superfamily acetyltransferase